MKLKKINDNNKKRTDETCVMCSWPIPCQSSHLIDSLLFPFSYTIFIVKQHPNSITSSFTNKAYQTHLIPLKKPWSAPRWHIIRSSGLHTVACLREAVGFDCQGRNARCLPRMNTGNHLLLLDLWTAPLS
jgi:hypothetical protein